MHIRHICIKLFPSMKVHDKNVVSSNNYSDESNKLEELASKSKLQNKVLKKIVEKLVNQQGKKLENSKTK